MSFCVELSDRAYADLDRLAASLSERSPGAGDRFLACFEAALPRLETLPLTCGLAFENRESPEELRHLLFGFRKGRRYRALFIMRGATVKVLCVRAPGEKPVDLTDLIPE